MRDLKNDLETCNNATSGPWTLKIKGNSVQSYAIEGICSGMKMHGKDAVFISTAREGWPEAINRAIAAEAEVRKLKNDMVEIRQRLDKLRKLRELKKDYDEYKLQSEVEILQAQRTEDIELMEETLAAQKLGLATIAKLRKALALAHSMILGGEQHTEQSRRVIEDALGLR